MSCDKTRFARQIYSNEQGKRAENLLRLGKCLKDQRIYDHPYLKFNRERKTHFKFDGNEYDAYEGETVGAALVAAGVKTISRSAKYHRPRGFLCFMGRCPNCMAEVNGVPNVRICREKVSQEMIVRTQNVFLNSRVDLYSVLDKLDFAFPVGFQYKRFIRPRSLWPFYERMIRSVAGIGRLPMQLQGQRAKPFHTRLVEADIAVVGGGPAGISAAIAGAEMGARVALVDEGNQLGGHLRWNTDMVDSRSEFAGMRAFQVAKKLADHAVTFSNISIFAPAIAIGVFSEGILAAESSDGLVEIKPKRYLFATGCTDRLPIFENNDLPGIITKTSAQILMHLYGIKPGNEAAVYCSSDEGFVLASQLLDAAVRVNAVVDERKDASQSKMLDTVVSKDVPIYFNSKVFRASGRNRLNSIETSGEDGQEHEIRCDVLCFAVGRQPVCELAQQAGCELKYDPALESATAIHDEHMRSNLESYVAGEMLGTQPLSMMLLEGRLAGLSAALSLGLGDSARLREQADLTTDVSRNRRS